MLHEIHVRLPSHYSFSHVGTASLRLMKKCAQFRCVKLDSHRNEGRRCSSCSVGVRTEDSPGQWLTVAPVSLPSTIVTSLFRTTIWSTQKRFFPKEKRLVESPIEMYCGTPEQLHLPCFKSGTGIKTCVAPTFSSFTRIRTTIRDTLVTATITRESPC